MRYLRKKPKIDVDELKRQRLFNAEFLDSPMMPNSTGYWMGPSSASVYLGTSSLRYETSYGNYSTSPFSNFQSEVLRQADGFQIKKEDDQVKVVLNKETVSIKKRALSF